MRVKRLEIQGFKSFKDKTIIHFDHSITGIVGPNGCGKSNIVDAFFWVMGEQSYKHMRGSNSDDLIFNGSSKYNPLGYAEATLVLETDYVDTKNAPAGATTKDIPFHLRSKEVGITRRVYRGGEGEYFINGVPVRLKDIKELFMDTGVGSKGYSVIEQGQIGKIINSKPDDRRLLIEEAAGIAKYKARKNESIRKMDAAKANLERLNDVIKEIERSLASLERQAARARRYREYKEELQDKELTWGRRKAKIYQNAIDFYRGKKDGLELELTSFKTELHTLENDLEVDRTSQLDDSKSVESFQTELQKLSSDLAHEQSALELSRQRQEDLSGQLRRYEEERAEVSELLRAEKEKLTAEATTSEKDLEELAELDRKILELDGKASEWRVEVDQFQTSLASAKDELMKNMARLSELNSSQASVSAQFENARSLSSEKEESRQAVTRKSQEIQGEIDRILMLRRDKEGQHTLLQRDVDAVRETISEQERRLGELEKKREEQISRSSQLESKVSSLRELIESREGLAEGPKAALNWAQESQTELRSIAELFEVPSEYQRALEGLLERQVDFLSASNLSDAVRALGSIREGQAGRAVIHLPGESKQGLDRNLVSECLRELGFEVRGSLSEKIRASDTVRSFLEDVYLVQNFDPLNGEALDRLAGLGEFKLVSMDGDAIEFTRSGQYLKGGSVQEDLSASLLGRKRAVEEFSQELNLVRAELDQTERDIAATKETLSEKKSDLSRLEENLRTLLVELASIDKENESWVARKEEADAAIREVETELSSLRELIAKHELHLKEIELQLKECDDSRSRIENGIAEKDSGLAQKSAHLRELEEEIQDRRLLRVSLDERIQSARRELESKRRLISDRESRLEEIGSSVERVKSERESFSSNDQSHEERIGALSRELGSQKEKLSEVRDHLEQATQRIQTSMERMRELHQGIEAKTTESSDAAVEIEKQAAELNHLKQNLEEKYGAVPFQQEMEAPVVTQEMTEDEEKLLFEEVERLREKIRRLGEVNTMAIDEYEELKVRHETLTRERADLEESIKNLEQAIEHINATSKERFRSAFESISKRFEALFPIVFGGGMARLSLVFPEGSQDVLDAGVDILAQPPGKKIVNITALSGGEKALTAVSLLFSIFMVKPSPFCVLDEVDAPLDDANIGKFNTVLKEMAATTQFILITHNKKTMELNDCLYGVTMEEPGVSKMVSIEMS